MGSSRLHDLFSPDVQVRQTARFPGRLVEISHTAPCLLWVRTGFEGDWTLSARRGGVPMKSFFNSPQTMMIHEVDLRNPPLCEELRVRDILNNLVVTTSGEFVAAYELSGIHSQYHDDETRNRTKGSLEAVLRALPERSVRVHVRFEICQDAGSGIDQYIRSSRTENTVLQGVDKDRYGQWRQKEAAGEFLDFRLHLML